MLGGEGDTGGTGLDVDVGGGRHLFAVVGAVPRGELTAVASPFRVEPALG